MRDEKKATETMIREVIEDVVDSIAEATKEHGYAAQMYGTWAGPMMEEENRKLLNEALSAKGLEVIQFGAFGDLYIEKNVSAEKKARIIKKYQENYQVMYEEACAEAQMRKLMMEIVAESVFGSGLADFLDELFGEETSGDYSNKN